MKNESECKAPNYGNVFAEISDKATNFIVIEIAFN